MRQRTESAGARSSVRRHRMPFGAEVVEGGTRFRLWAPAARSVDLCLAGEAGGQFIPMVSIGGGWHELVTDRAPAGSSYRYRIDGALQVPDPASRYNPRDVHGASEVVDPGRFEWQDGAWRGRPWQGAVVYELHVGSFTPEGNFAGVRRRLDHLAQLGVTAIELMPLADFPGTRNWGYDGVLPFAPDSSYGSPDDLKDLVQSAHLEGMMVLLDVVYNHFGPEGNYLHGYAPAFFGTRRQTPWGGAINFDGEDCRVVRDFFIHNALYWLEEYHFDGLRLDAVHAIADDSVPDILTELATRVHAGPGRGRHVQLILENDDNETRYLSQDARGYAAQWNDDLHHVLHVLATGETGGYYSDYAEAPAARLARCLAEGFAYQGEESAYRHGQRRGEPSAHLPPSAFVGFLQNHDQVGNRAMGERITALASRPALECATAILLLAPAIPLLFMGQEWGSGQPFPFFCDFGPELGQMVTEGRRREFARFPEFSDPAARERIPDPNAPATFASAVLRWDDLAAPGHRRWLDYHRDLLRLRHREIVPLLSAPGAPTARGQALGERGLTVQWRFGDAARLALFANLGDGTVETAARPEGRLIFASSGDAAHAAERGTLPGWSVLWYVAGSERS